MKKFQNENGFTWIEILVILAIVAVLALIAYPNLKGVGVRANESGMRTAMRAFREANEAYRHVREPNQYAPNLTQLVTPDSGPSLLHEMWNQPSVHGFTVTYYGGGEANPTTYALLATPRSTRGEIDTYCVDHKGIVMGSMKGEKDPEASVEGCQGGVPIVG